MSGLTRREAIAMAAAGSAAQAQRTVPNFDPALAARYDKSAEDLLKRQNTNPGERGYGSIPDDTGLYFMGTAAGIIETFASSFLCPQSKFHKNRLMIERAGLAAAYLTREQLPDGNAYLPITNFDSPPDTAFIVNGVATTAWNARQYGSPDIFKMVEPFLRKATGALVQGGVHTPNHRWVVCSALAQLHALFPAPEIVKRIDQWLAEGIDIDSDGQYTERSAYTYSPIVDRSLVIVAKKLNRPELLEPVRRNLNAMLYLMHADYEVVTEISRRQDLNQRGTIAPYWFSYAHLARTDNNGQFAAIANSFASVAESLGALLEYPELRETGPAPAAIPTNYVKLFPKIGVARIRRGPVSATVLAGKTRFFLLRRGEAVIGAVRFASAFFGKGQFASEKIEQRDGGHYLTQSLSGPYYQPFDPPRRITTDNYDSTRRERKQSNVCHLEQSVFIKELDNGFSLRIQAKGTNDVPLAIEINLREGGKFDGCEPVPKVSDGWILPKGFAVYRAGADAIKFGPGAAPNQYTQVRGADAKLPGPSVYITGSTPFDHTLTFEWA